MNWTPRRNRTHHTACRQVPWLSPSCVVVVDSVHFLQIKLFKKICFCLQCLPSKLYSHPEFYSLARFLAECFVCHLTVLCSVKLNHNTRLSTNLGMLAITVNTFVWSDLEKKTFAVWLRKSSGISFPGRIKRTVERQPNGRNISKSSKIFINHFNIISTFWTN